MRGFRGVAVAGAILSAFVSCARPGPRGPGAGPTWVDVLTDTVVGTVANSALEFRQTLTYFNRAEHARLLRRCTFTVENAQQDAWVDVFNNVCIGKDIIDTVRPADSVVFPISVRAFLDCAACEPAWKSSDLGPMLLRLRLNVRPLNASTEAAAEVDHWTQRTSRQFVLLLQR